MVLPWSFLRPNSISSLAYHLIFCYRRKRRGKGVMNGSSGYVTEGHGPSWNSIPWAESGAVETCLKGQNHQRETLLLWRYQQKPDVFVHSSSCVPYSQLGYRPRLDNGRWALRNMGSVQPSDGDPLWQGISPRRFLRPSCRHKKCDLARLSQA